MDLLKSRRKTAKIVDLIILPEEARREIDKGVAMRWFRSVKCKTRNVERESTKKRRKRKKIDTS